MSSPTAAPSGEHPTKFRHVVMVLIASASATAYLTRHAIAPAVTTIQGEAGLTSEQMGLILGIFSLGYFVFQIPTGWLGIRFGTRFTLAALCAGWSLCTVWFASVSSYTALLVARFLFGGMQAGLVPNSAKAVKDWFPVQERGFASGANASAMSVGGAVTMALTALMLESFSWRMTFIIFAGVSAVWAVAFCVGFRTTPDQHPRVNAAELALIRGNHGPPSDNAPGGAPPRENESAGEPISARLITDSIRSLSLWAICVQAAFRAAGYQLFVTWFPAILEKGYGVTRQEAGLLSTSPLIGVVAGSLLGGWLIDFLLTRTGSKRISRCGVAITALSLSSLLCVMAAWSTSADLLVAAMALGAFFSGLGGPAGWVATMDIAGRYTAFLMAVMNMAGTVGGFLLPIIVGRMIDNIEATGGDWNQVFYLVSAIYLAGAVSWIFVNPNRPVSQP